MCFGVVGCLSELVVAFMMAVNSSWVIRLSGVTLESLSFTNRLIQLISGGLGVFLSQLPILAY